MNFLLIQKKKEIKTDEYSYVGEMLTCPLLWFKLSIFLYISMPLVKLQSMFNNRVKGNFSIESSQVNGINLQPTLTQELRMNVITMVVMHKQTHINSFRMRRVFTFL